MLIHLTGTAHATGLLLVASAAMIQGSIGDRSLANHQCMSACRTSCINGTHSKLSLPLRITLWTCEDDCSYQCMHNLTDIAVAQDIPFAEKLSPLQGLPPDRVVQYHGKWPFYRFLGIQEPLSVLFSAGNLYMHAKYGSSMVRQLPRDLPRPLSSAIKVLPAAGINLWVWSIVFHTRDKKWTERLDYFSAALSMLCSLYYAIIRLGGLYRTENRHLHTIWRRMLLWVGGFIFISHISYLTFWKFDYSYNMAFNITIGLLHNLLWTGWTIFQTTLPASPPTRRPLYDTSDSTAKQRAPHYFRPAIVLTLLSSLTALELLDFPPILRCLDAHALWHAATIPVIKWWYECLLIDAWWICDQQVYNENSKARS